MSGFLSGQSVWVVNVVPRGRPKHAIKQVVVSDDDEDTVCCKICGKRFLSSLALGNHVLMTHFNAYSSGDPTLWTEPILIKTNNVKSNNKFSKQKEKQKTKAVLLPMKPGALTSFASEDMNYINIETEDDCEPPTTKEKRLELVEDDKPIKEVGKKRKEVQPITGPYKCIQDGCCQIIFFSCCEYSTHCRDEHTRRRKGLRCQVCEKPLSLDVDQQHQDACETEIPDGSLLEEINAEVLSDSSQGLNAKHKHNDLVEASVEVKVEVVDGDEGAKLYGPPQYSPSNIAADTEIPDGSLLEEIDAEVLSDSSQGLNAKQKHTGLVDASVEVKVEVVDGDEDAELYGPPQYSPSRIAADDEIPDGSSSEEIDAEALSDSSRRLNAKHKHNGLVEACVEVHEGNNKWSHVVDAADANASNCCEQNLAAPQYQGQIDHRTTNEIPRFTEQRFYGGEYAHLLDFDLKHYNSPSGYAQKFGAAVQKKRRLSTDTTTEEGNTNYEDIEKTSPQNTQKTVFTKTNNSTEDSTISNANKQEKCVIVKNIIRNINKRINNYTCDVCKINFNCKYILVSHINSHYTLLKQKPNTLDIKHKKNYVNIVKNNEQLIKGKVCNFCKKSFVHKGDFTRHIKTHTGGKQYQCNVCDKYLARQSTLTIHLRTHTGEKPYQCNVCNKSFTDKLNLRRHIRTHTGEKPYQCNVCKMFFSQHYNLTIHERTHTGEKLYQCNVCNKSFSDKRNLLKHIRTHTGEKPYQCNVCNKSFSDKRNLLKHIRTHTGEKPYQCNVCDKSFSDKRNLLVHIRTHTGEKRFQCNVCDKYFTRQSTLTIHLRTHTGEKPYQCNVCNKSFSDNCNLRTHIRTHTGEKPYQCNFCERYFSHKLNLTQHVRTHTGEKPYQCNVCKRYFSHKFNLTTHLRTHTGEKPYQCNVCNKSFSDKSVLLAHIRTHTGVKPYQCNVCNKSFSDKGNLRGHIRTHTGEKPYRCNVCKRYFSHKFNLTLHVRTHTGEKPYQCNVCNKYFIQQSKLIIHIRTHTGEKPYQCNVCNKSFSDKSDIRRHIMTHTGEKPYQCNVCDKCFARQSTLTKHLRIHTGEKPYQCNICDKCFSRQSTLTVHLRTHTGEKPYQCNVCNKSFSDKSVLLAHIRTHKGKKPSV